MHLNIHIEYTYIYICKYMSYTSIYTHRDRQKDYEALYIYQVCMCIHIRIAGGFPTYSVHHYGPHSARPGLSVPRVAVAGKPHSANKFSIVYSQYSV